MALDKEADFEGINLEIWIGYSLPSRKVVEILQRAIEEYGKPLGILPTKPNFCLCAVMPSASFGQ